MTPIPPAALNQHIAILGKTGAGKSYAARGVVEHLLAQDRQVCILDPTSAWWGLRLASNGKDKGYDVVLLGGERADIPLHERSGSAVARLVTEQGASVVIDTGGMTVGEYTRWFIDFAGTLYTTVKSPLHLVIDEAHHFMPQGKSPDVDAGRMLHAGNRLMSGGRSRGIRGILLTQRPAKLHKDSLTCADTLVAMRMIAPQDRAAVKDWIDGAGDPARGRDVLDSLASLERGEGWVWYPEGKHLERVKFPRINTYDSSATPADGGKSAPKVREIDLSKVREAMDGAVKEAEANDPKALRARVAELTKQLAAAQKAQAAPKPATVDPAQVEAIRHQAKLDAASGLASIIAGRANQIRDMGIDIAATVKEKFAEHERFLRETVSCTVKAVEANRPAGVTVTIRSGPTTTKAYTPRTPSGGNGHSAVTGGERSVLIACAQHEGGCDREQIGILTGYKRSTRDAYIQRLRTKGYLDDGETIAATEAGIDALGDFDRLPTGDDLRMYWLARLPEGERRVLESVCEAYPKAVSREAIGELTDYKRSTRDAYIQRLGTRKLVKCDRDGVIASELLFGGAA